MLNRICCLAVGLLLSLVFFFSSASFLCLGTLVDARPYSSCLFLWLQFFFPALLVALFLCTSSLQCNSFWLFSCSWLALHFHSGLCPYWLSLVVDASLLEQKNESTLSYFLHALVVCGEVKVFSSYCVKAIRLSRVAV